MQRISLRRAETSPRILRLSQSASDLTVRSERGSFSSLFIELTSKKSHVRSAITFDLQPKSSLTAVFLWRGPGEANITQHVQVSAGAKFHLLNVTLGGARHSLESQVAGKDAVSHLSWIVRARGQEQCELSVRTVFSAARGRGDTVVRGVCEDRAHISCRGAIAVTPEGGGTQTHLSERFLLLDPDAQADAVPELKIETDNVRAGHSAAVSRLSDEDLFYFASRGIAEKKARKLFIDGFLGDLLTAIPITGLRKYLY